VRIPNSLESLEKWEFENFLEFRKLTFTEKEMSFFQFLTGEIKKFPCGDDYQKSYREFLLFKEGIQDEISEFRYRSSGNFGEIIFVKEGTNDYSFKKFPKKGDYLKRWELVRKNLEFRERWEKIQNFPEVLEIKEKIFDLKNLIEEIPKTWTPQTPFAEVEKHIQRIEEVKALKKQIREIKKSLVNKTDSF
jgi:hypothetical protein